MDAGAALVLRTVNAQTAQHAINVATRIVYALNYKITVNVQVGNALFVKNVTMHVDGYAVTV